MVCTPGGTCVNATMSLADANVPPAVLGNLVNSQLKLGDFNQVQNLSSFSGNGQVPPASLFNAPPGQPLNFTQFKFGSGTGLEQSTQGALQLDGNRFSADQLVSSVQNGAMVLQNQANAQLGQLRVAVNASFSVTGSGLVRMNDLQLPSGSALQISGANVRLPEAPPSTSTQSQIVLNGDAQLGGNAGPATINVAQSGTNLPRATINGTLFSSGSILGSSGSLQIPRDSNLQFSGATVQPRLEVGGRLSLNGLAVQGGDLALQAGAVMNITAQSTRFNKIESCPSGTTIYFQIPEGMTKGTIMSYEPTTLPQNFQCKVVLVQQNGQQSTPLTPVVQSRGRYLAETTTSTSWTKSGLTYDTATTNSAASALSPALLVAAAATIFAVAF